MENQEKYNEVTDTEVVKVDFEQKSKERKKESFISRFVYSIIAFIAALIFIIGRNEIFGVLGYIVGAMALVLGVVTIIAFLMKKGRAHVISLIAGILEIMAGIFCMVRPFTITNLSIYVFAIIIFISGIVLAYFAIRDKKLGVTRWLPSLILGILLALLGLAMLFFVSQSRMVIAVIVGVALLVSSIFNLVSLALK